MFNDPSSISYFGGVCGVFLCRYGPHLSQTSYVICDDPPTVSRIFHRLRNFHGEDSYPQRCGGVRVANVRDVTTGYDSSRADRTCVCLLIHIRTCTNT